MGREEELELLLRRWSKAKTREGQVVLLSGEAVSASRGLRLRYWNASLQNGTRDYAISARRSILTVRFIRLLGRWNVLPDWRTTIPRKQGSTNACY